MTQKEYAIGIDIGGTNTAWGIVNRTGEILHRNSVKTVGHATPEIFIQALYQQINPHIESLGKNYFCGIGIGAPTANNRTGEIVAAANLPWEYNIPLKALSEAIFELPTVINNDANATALGEMIYGAAKGMKNFIVITLGTGLGCGIVVDGKLLYGHSGLAGELGHVIAVRNGRSCGCGRKGCLERYASASGIVLTAQDLLKNIDATLQSQNNNQLQSLHLSNKTFNAHDIYEAALGGDSIALTAFEITGTILGQELADAVAYTEPEAIILFGGLAKAGDLLLKPTQKAFDENLLYIYKDKVKLLLSELEESDAAVLGAAAMVR